LLTRFGSLKRLRAATAEEVVEVPGIGRRTAEAVVEALRTDAQPGSTSASSPTPAINTATGELLDEPAGPAAVER